ncbi:Uncharacterised protein [Chryseobacterium taklimakanense]|uniref:Uncharacterized protein n=1 Tax=Chryseobacterium taklimakanense TaxID=536441 RepID=A0A239X8I2_9FLAO|nr:Uncharacterised protein [Chryseobacterium taklimakanense]
MIISDIRLRIFIIKTIETVLHILTLHGKIFERIFPMWKFAKLLPSKHTKSNLTFKICCPNFGSNYISKFQKRHPHKRTIMLLKSYRRFRSTGFHLVSCGQDESLVIRRSFFYNSVPQSKQEYFFRSKSLYANFLQISV